MDCRTFHRKLEDYLESGMDFSGRFGMERHAQQCLCCGKALSDALQLKQKISELQRVKAPANFESFLLREIASHRSRDRFWGIRKYWIYGFDWPSWRKLAFSSSLLAILALGIVYVVHRSQDALVSNPPVLTVESTGIAEQAKATKSKTDPGVDALQLQPKPAPAVEWTKLEEMAQADPRSKGEKAPPIPKVNDMDYVEYLLPGPDDYAVPVRLPKKIPMRYNQMSEEYFIRNVSH